MKLKDLDKFLKDLLSIDEIGDISLNGIQIGDEDQEIKKIAVAVDANLKTIEKSIDNGADVLLVHHGIFWGKVFPFKGPEYNKLKSLVKNDISLYAIHLPLDNNLPLGNNYQLAEKLCLSNIKEFGKYHGINLGFSGEIDYSLEELIDKCNKLSSTVRVLINDKSKDIKKIAIASGKAGGDILNQSIFSDCDLLITGEFEHSLYNTLIDYKANAITLGHYESEKYGVLALAKYLKEKFSFDTCFIEEQTGY